MNPKSAVAPLSVAPARRPAEVLWPRRMNYLTLRPFSWKDSVETSVRRIPSTAQHRPV
jgi:hypothetical protein